MLELGNHFRYETYLVYERHVSELYRCANVKMR